MIFHETLLLVVCGLLRHWRRFFQLYDVIMVSQSSEKHAYKTSDEDDVCVVGSLVKGKGKVPKRWTQSFLKSYTQQWPFITQLRQRASMFSAVFTMQFPCAHGGKNDRERHLCDFKIPQKSCSRPTRISQDKCTFSKDKIDNWCSLVYTRRSCFYHRLIWKVTQTCF